MGMGRGRCTIQTVCMYCVSLQVSLKERVSHGHYAAGQDLETVFSLSPVIQEGDQILVESYARIKHLATRTWLHLDKGEGEAGPEAGREE